MSGRPAVVLMLKAPRAGRVKTRLCPPLDPAAAASLAAALARDAVARARALGEVIVAYAPPDGLDELRALLPEVRRWTPQPDGSLGRRQDAAVAAAAAWRREPLLVMGSDSPTLPDGPAAEALAALASGRADVVLGPAEDGGYYLLGLRRPVPGLLDGIPWSTTQVAACLARNARRLGARLHTLASWYDLDTAADLGRLEEELAADPAARARAPATAAWLTARAAPPA